MAWLELLSESRVKVRRAVREALRRIAIELTFGEHSGVRDALERLWLPHAASMRIDAEFLPALDNVIHSMLSANFDERAQSSLIAHLCVTTLVKYCCDSRLHFFLIIIIILFFV